jgi:hypothetical protein
MGGFLSLEQTKGMKASAIISKLKASDYKFTEAGKLRSALKKLPEEKRDFVITLLRSELGKAVNADIHAPLKEVIADFRYG